MYYLLALLVAEAEELTADVLLQHEVVVDAAGHVGEPHVQGALAVDVRQLGADGQLEDGDLLGNALLAQEPGNKVGDSGLQIRVVKGFNLMLATKLGETGLNQQKHAKN